MVQGDLLLKASDSIGHIFEKGTNLSSGQDTNKSMVMEPLSQDTPKVFRWILATKPSSQEDSPKTPIRSNHRKLNNRRSPY